jgi:hypothetical protein
VVTTEEWQKTFGQMDEDEIEEKIQDYLDR